MANTTANRHFIHVPDGYRSREAALFVAQLDDQLALLRADLEGATTDELSWQAAPGMNTIGMLLAHNAIVEAFWMGYVRGTEADITATIGIGMDDDGMPIPEGAPPPANLAGRDLAWYLDLLARARDDLKRGTRDLTDADLESERTRPRPNGQMRTTNVRWIYYHLLEHFAGHYGQILMLRHQYRTAQALDRA